jgi:hypothetical protein
MIRAILYNFTKEKINSMENKLNLESTIKYSEEFSKILCDRFFSTEKRITGEQILNLTNIRQINLFVIRILFSKWQKEQGKIKSSYFDYTNHEIQKALKDFLNKLSQHISVAKEDFYPLLKLACIKTIQVIYAPYDFFMQEISGDSDDNINVEKLKESSKYLKINNGFFNELLQRLNQSGAKELSSTEARGILEEVFLNYSGSPEDGEAYLAHFNEVLELRVEDLFTPEKEVKPAENETSYSTINDDHANRIGETIGEALKKISKTNLQESVSVNQKFMFVHVLFNGNPKLFEEALGKIQEFDSKEQAMQFLEKELKNTYQWDKESEEVGEFYDLVLTRFD